MKPVIARIIRPVLWGALSIIVAGIAAIVAVGLNDDARTADVAVVLGAKVEESGAPSGRLRARVERAAALYADSMVSAIIVSGGVGKEGWDEAAVMRFLLLEQGVPIDAIIVDSLGVTTAATARNAAAIMKQHGFTSAIVVTQYFHIVRTMFAMHASGIANVGHVHADYFEVRDIYSTLRELPALVVYWARA